MRKPVFIGLGVALLASAAVLIWINRAAGEPLTEDALEAARRRWQDARVLDYDVEVTTTGAREGKYRVVVRNGKVRRATANGRDVAFRHRLIWTVPGMFDTLAVELHNRKDPKIPFGVDGPDQVILRTAFDPALGYVTYYLRHVVGRGSSIEWHVKVIRKG